MSGVSIGAVGRLFDEWQASHRYPPSKREVAEALGVSPSSIDQWRAGAKPSPGYLSALAHEMHYPYRRLLDAMLEDQGYLPRPDTDNKKAARRGARRGLGGGLDAETKQSSDVDDSRRAGHSA